MWSNRFMFNCLVLVLAIVIESIVIAAPPPSPPPPVLTLPLALLQLPPSIASVATPLASMDDLPHQQHHQQQQQHRPFGLDFFDHEFMGMSEPFDPHDPHIDDDEMGMDDPETLPRLFQGDIAIDPFMYLSLRLGVNPMKHPKRLWPNGTIPFELSTDYKSNEREAILRVLKTFNGLTCVRFTPYTGEEDDYLLITPPDDDVPKGCWSFVGKKGGEQLVSLQQPDDKSAHCFSSEGRIMHELMHAIGIYHEQSRADRDNFVKIHWDNIVPKFRKNFKLISRKKGKHSFDYDYNSVMHYGEFYFSKKKGEMPTMTPLQPGVRIGQRKTLSKIDCLKINDLYGCLKGRHAKMYRSFCNLLGL